MTHRNLRVFITAPTLTYYEIEGELNELVLYSWCLIVCVAEDNFISIYFS